jgi:hypothetical protein
MPSHHSGISSAWEIFVEIAVHLNVATSRAAIQVGELNVWRPCSSQASHEGKQRGFRN